MSRTAQRLFYPVFSTSRNITLAYASLSLSLENGYILKKILEIRKLATLGIIVHDAITTNNSVNILYA